MLPSSRTRLDSSAGITSVAASRSAGLQERTRWRCSSTIGSRIVKLPSALVVQARLRFRPDGFPSHSMRWSRRRESGCSVLSVRVCRWP